MVFENPNKSDMNNMRRLDFTLEQEGNLTLEDLDKIEMELSLDIHAGSKIKDERKTLWSVLHADYVKTWESLRRAVSEGKGASKDMQKLRFVHTSMKNLIAKPMRRFAR